MATLRLQPLPPSAFCDQPGYATAALAEFNEKLIKGKERIAERGRGH